MDDLAALLFEDDEPSAQERAQALAAALRRQRDVGTLGMLTGDKVLSGLGQTLVGQAAQGQGRMADAANHRLSRALRARELRERALDRAQQRDFMLATLGIKQQEKRAEDVNKDVELLSKRMEAAPSMRNDLQTLTNAARQENIPGVSQGYRFVPDFAEGWFTSPEGVRVRQAARGVLATIIKERSGTAASEKEIDRTMEELGMGNNATEEQFRLGLQRMTENAKGTLKAKEAGARPEAVEIARQRGLVTSEDLPEFTATPGTEPAPKRRSAAEIRRELEALKRGQGK